MTLGGILILLLALTSLGLFIYFTVVTAKSWGVLHTILIWVLFIEVWVFMVCAAGVQATRVKYTEQAAKNEKLAEQALAETQRLLWGDFDVNDVNLNAVVPAQGKLRRMTSDRGRVWRAVNYIQTAGNSYELELAAADVGDPDGLGGDPAAGAPAPTSESLPVDLVVYAFAEELNEDGQPIPTYYLGEFSVTQSQAGAVTVEPTLTLGQNQTDLISNGSASTWTLYELLPLDSHTAFAAPGSEASNDAIFGRMDEETLATLLGNVPEENNRQQDILNQYTKDGARADDDDPVEAIWIQVEMLKKYDVDVDSQETAIATERGYFDTLGRSIDTRLKRDAEGEDGSVSLSPDTKERIVLKAEAAQPLIDNGTARLVQRIYVRPLNDYEQAFNLQFVQMHDLGERIELFKRESAELTKANALGQEMISFRQVENQKLTSDLANYQKEMAVLNVALNEATQELDSLKSNLSLLYRKLQNHRSKLTSR